MKAFRFKDGVVHWGLRRPLLFIVPWKVLDLHHLLARELWPWVQDCRRRFGDSCLVRSHKAIAASGVELAGDQYAQSEWICSSSVLILLFLVMRDLRKRKSEHALARGVLVGTMRSILETETIVELAAVEGDAELIARCSDDEDSDVCHHVRQLSHRVHSESDDDGLAGLAQRLDILCEGRAACVAPRA